MKAALDRLVRQINLHRELRADQLKKLAEIEAHSEQESAALAAFRDPEFRHPV